MRPTRHLDSNHAINKIETSWYHYRNGAFHTNAMHHKPGSNLFGFCMELLIRFRLHFIFQCFVERCPHALVNENVYKQPCMKVPFRAVENMKNVMIHQKHKTFRDVVQCEPTHVPKNGAVELPSARRRLANWRSRAAKRL